MVFYCGGSWLGRREKTPKQSPCIPPKHGHITKKEGPSPCLTVQMLQKAYPLLTLKLWGTICPCLEKEEDAAARKAAWSLSSQPIRWRRRLRTSNEGGGEVSVSGFISGIFGGSSSCTSNSSSSSARYDSVEATFSVVDSLKGPMLVVETRANATRNKSVPLRMIKTVQSRSSGIISSLVGSRSGIEILDKSGNELIRFDLLKSSPASDTGTAEHESDVTTTSSGMEDAEESARDDTIDLLEILIQWERRRQACLVTLGEDQDNSDDVVDEFDEETGNSPRSSPSKGKGGGIIAERAQKMKHFAQRENRKAKYVKEAGGLKYTAIAMANRS